MSDSISDCFVDENSLPENTSNYLLCKTLGFESSSPSKLSAGILRSSFCENLLDCSSSPSKHLKVKLGVYRKVTCV
jgi:hypothetical protein